MRIHPKSIYELSRMALSDFFKDKVPKLASSLSYVTIFAIPGLLIIILWISGIFYDPAQIQGKLMMELTELLGTKSVNEIQGTLIRTKFDYNSMWAKVLGVVTLILGATSIFGEIQDSINTIWGLRTRPKAGIVKIFINRLLSFSIVVSLGFILLVSLVLNAVISYLFAQIEHFLPHIPIAVVYVVNQAVMALVLIILFGTIFKVLPDAKIKWKDVLLSSTITTALFMLGKYLIGFFLTRNAAINAYGSAGSVIIILLWVYYSSIILYLGAEFTQAYLKMKGRHIEPNKYAVWVEKKEVEVDSNTQTAKKTVDESAGKVSS